MFNKKTFLVLTVLVVLILPQIASAAILPFNFGQDSIVPCGTKANPEMCTLCDFFVGIRTLINLLISLAIIITPLIILFGGVFILTSGGSPDKLATGKRVITLAIVGIVIILGAWLIINTVMNGLIDKSHTPLPWNKFDCSSSNNQNQQNNNNNGNDNQENKNVCGELNPSLAARVGWCSFGSSTIKFRCNSGIQSQIDAGLVSSDVKNLIIAVHSSLIALPPIGLGPEKGENASRVSSLADNSLGQCPKNYPTQCQGNTDSCEGTCCAHREGSDHYCQGQSYAIDFGADEYAADICLAILKYAGEKEAYVLKEGDHLHVGLGKDGGCPHPDAYNITLAECNKLK